MCFFRGCSGRLGPVGFLLGAREGNGEFAGLFVDGVGGRILFNIASRSSAVRSLPSVVLLRWKARDSLELSILPGWDILQLHDLVAVFSGSWKERLC